MPRTTRRLLPPVAGKTPTEAMQLEQFARRLHSIMLDKGLSQSELARKIWGSTTDHRGYEVAKNRDRISVYLAGRTIPDPKNLKLLADALDVEIKELAPELVASAVERDHPEIAVAAVAGHPESAVLRINTIVPMDVAVRVMALLSDAKRDGKPLE